MKLPFKITSGSPSNPPCIGDSNFMSHYTGVNTSMAWEEIEPGIRHAVEKFILPYLGSEMYNLLCDYFDAPSAATADKDRALALLQDATAYYTVYHVAPERNTFLASMGMVQNAPTGGSQPTPQWAFKTAMWNALSNGDRFLDILIAHLESRVAVNDSWFNPWKTSEAYKATGSTYFRQTGDMDNHLNIQMGRRSFLSVVKYLREIEEEQIAPILCNDLTQEIVTQMASNAISPANQTLLRYIRKAVANLGVAAAIPHHRIVIDGDGFRVVSQTDMYDDRRNQTNNVHESAILGLQQAAAQKGARALADLQALLESNADTYPLWRDSDCRSKPKKNSHGLVVSPDRRGGVGLF